MRLFDHFDYHAREMPDAEFAVFGGRRTSWGEALAEANRIASALAAAGLGPGDRAAFLAKNSVESVLFFYGAAKAGVVPVPLNYRLAPPEWSYIVNDAEARVLVARGELAAQIDAVRGELPKVERWIALEAERPGWTPWRAWLDAQPATPPARHVTDDADLYQMNTSGTTGRPKGAVLTHRAVTANLAQFGTALGLLEGSDPPGGGVVAESSTQRSQRRGGSALHASAANGLGCHFRGARDA